MGLRVGVLTFHRCINYGSYWQARCLVEGLRARGHDAVLLDHESRRVRLAEWKCALRPVLPTPVPAPDLSLYRRKIHAFSRGVAALPLSRPFSLENPAAMEAFDVVVVGSDEVWNLRHPWLGGYVTFFGSGVRAGRLVSYAASFGSYGASEGLEPSWAERLRAFCSISVRDENSRALIQSALGFEPEVVLDPCLQFGIGTDGAANGGRPDYVAVYGHNFSDWYVRRVRRWARERGRALVSIGYRNDWADEQWITAGPQDFARFMAGADAVATNFFHGCVFALANATPFVSELSPYRSTKVQDLLRTVGGERHLVTDTTPATSYDDALAEPVDGAVMRRIEQLRRSADAYLDAALA